MLAFNPYSPRNTKLERVSALPIIILWSSHLVINYACLFLFQFDCTNTLNDQILEDVKVEMEPSDSDFEVVSYIPRPSLPYNTPGTTYTLIKLPEDASSGL